jgi:hypothetical protein
MLPWSGHEELVMARFTCIAMLGLVLASCGGSTVDRELATSETEAATPETTTPDEVAESTTEAAAEPPADDETAPGDAGVGVGDRVRLARRVGTITPPSGTGGTPVEAAAGKTGQVTAVQDPSGLVEVTWDAQSWTLHGGYAWDGKETIEVADLESLASRSGGDVELESFTSTIHLGYLEVVQRAPEATANP